MDKKEINIDELLKESNDAVLKMSNIFNELSEKEEFKNNKELEKIQNKLIKIKEKRN